MRTRAIAVAGGLLLVGVTAGPAPAQQSVVISRTPPAWLGVGYDVRWVQEDTRCEPRVLVQNVVQGSPADRAGLRSGDVIVEVNGRPLPAGRLAGLAARLHPGDSVRLRVDREGRTREITAVAGLRPERPPVTLVPTPDGVRANFGPVIELEEGTLVARNVDAAPRSPRGYWLATRDGRTIYRRMSPVSRDELDQRVTRLLRCVESAEWSPPLPPDPEVEQVQRRADSLRVVITRRALERGAAPAAGPARARVVAPLPPSPASPGATDGLLGAELTALEPELAEYFRNVRQGLLVLRVGAGSRAHEAGLRPGDVIVQGDGRRLESVAELQRLLSFPSPQPLELRVVRKGTARSISLPRR